MNSQLTQKNFVNKNQIQFQIYGVKIGVRAQNKTNLKKIYSQLERVFPNGFEPVSEQEIEYRFLVRWTKNNGIEIFRNDEKVSDNLDEENYLEIVENQIRITIAEFAVGKVFLHAGVVGWKGRAIIIPAKSFAGKTTLVAELVKKGALYYSDEYAVLDAEGNVQPYPKWLSLRGIIDDYTQLDCSVESLGGIAGTETIPVGMVLIAKYNKGKKIPKKWKPKILSQGQGMMEIISNTFPIRNKPDFVLKVLNKLTSRAIIIKTVRGEADEFADTLLNYFEGRARTEKLRLKF